MYLLLWLCVLLLFISILNLPGRDVAAAADAILRLQSPQCDSGSACGPPGAEPCIAVSNAAAGGSSTTATPFTAVGDSETTDWESQTAVLDLVPHFPKLDPTAILAEYRRCRTLTRVHCHRHRHTGPHTHDHDDSSVPHTAARVSLVVDPKSPSRHFHSSSYLDGTATCLVEGGVTVTVTVVVTVTVNVVVIMTVTEGDKDVTYHRLAHPRLPPLPLTTSVARWLAQRVPAKLSEPRQLSVDANAVNRNPFSVMTAAIDFPGAKHAVQPTTFYLLLLPADRLTDVGCQCRCCFARST